ncbi:MAG: type ISP restriction/modification enzyme [Anaerolineae bacterium]
MPKRQPAAINAYYAQLDNYRVLGVDNELGLRSAFQTLLEEGGRAQGWTLIVEKSHSRRARPDGTFVDEFKLPRGWWEAKDTKDDLDTEIRLKIGRGYPLKNTIFEDTRRGVLYQDGKRVLDADLRAPAELQHLLDTFFGYTESHVEEFHQAVDAFRDQIPDLAEAMERIIEDERKGNTAFVAAFDKFLDLCRSALNPNISVQAVEEMLVQHLLTERLFRTIFDNPDFTRRNVIAAEIEKVIDALTSRSFSRAAFLKRLDPFYLAIEDAARGIGDYAEKQAFLNTVYERFFQGFSRKQADTHGIVYTPQPIVEFMVNSVDAVLKREFGKRLSSEGVVILDPATGTGNFIVNIVNKLDGSALPRKYAGELFANEIMLLPYYVASLNIEHAYFERTKHYAPFEGVVFADTLDLARPMQPSFALFSEHNTERVQREKDAPITVIIGNPPYNVGQQNEMDNNKNRRYDEVDRRVRATYARDSRATNKNALADVYVKFFRWATDRLGERDGIVCFVSNNSFVDQAAFDGMRKHLLQDFTQVYHLDLHGNVRKNPKLSGTTHNVFGIQVGVGVTVAIRNRQNPARVLRYHRVPEMWRKEDKLAYLAEAKGLDGVAWRDLTPDAKQTWLTEGMQADYDDFLPIGTKETKALRGPDAEAIFKDYGGGVKTNRDEWAYDFSRDNLIKEITHFIESYNAEVDRWKRRPDKTVNVDDFVTDDETALKWSRDLKLDLQRGRYAEFSVAKIRHALYRPFVHTYLFLDRILNEEVYIMPQVFPTPASEGENVAIWLKVGSEWPMFALMTNLIPDLLPQGGSQVFPLYVYDEDGGNRRDNVTDWALQKFQAAYGADVAKRDIFHYVYAVLHHPTYRERYKDNLKRELPRIPLVADAATFRRWADIGAQLAALHLGYESAAEYPLQYVENRSVPFTWRVTKMRLTPDRGSVVVNEALTLQGIPPEAFDYRLGNRSALEWVIDQYQVTRDKRSGLGSDPNRPDDPQYIVRLIGRVITVSLETRRLVAALAADGWPVEAPPS